MQASYQPNTLLNYSRSWDKFKSFLRTANVPLNLPCTEFQVAAFIAFLNKQAYKPSTIRVNISAISAVHKIYSLYDPTNSFIVARSLKGIEKLQKSSPRKLLPICRALLHRLLAVLEGTKSTYDALLFRSLFLLSYYCCLRASEVGYNKNCTHTLQLLSISVQRYPHPLQIKITFPSSKHSDAPTSLVLHPQQHVPCPVTALLQYLAVRGDRNGPLFLTQSAKPVTRAVYSKTLKTCLSSLCIPNKRYNTHSFRIGRATDLALMGASTHVIKSAGRWRSEAYLKYIRLGQISFPSI